MKPLSKQKREQLNFQVGSLAKSLFLSSDQKNKTWNWSNYVELISNLSNIEKLESEIKNFTNSERVSLLKIFLEWAEENGAKCSGMEIVQFDNFGMGLKATDNISKDTVLLNIPNTMLLSLENTNNELEEMFSHFPDRSDFQLAVILMCEKLKANNSHWKSYIEILPRRYSVPIYYTQSEMEIIKNTQAFQPAINQCRTTVMQYYYLYRYLHYVVKDQIPNSLISLLKEHFTFDLYR